MQKHRGARLDQCSLRKPGSRMVRENCIRFIPNPGVSARNLLRPFWFKPFWFKPFWFKRTADWPPSRVVKGPRGWQVVLAYLGARLPLCAALAGAKVASCIWFRSSCLGHGGASRAGGQRDMSIAQYRNVCNTVARYTPIAARGTYKDLGRVLLRRQALRLG